MKKNTLSIMVVACCLLPTLVQAQAYTDIVWDQVQNAYEDAANNGYEMKNYIIGAINENEENTWTFYLNSDYEYLFEGFCDADCNDLDLYLYNEAGNQLEKDELEDDFPIISFTPTVSGRYKIEIAMYSCSAEPCYWGLAIFQK